MSEKRTRRMVPRQTRPDEQTRRIRAQDEDGVTSDEAPFEPLDSSAEKTLPATPGRFPEESRRTPGRFPEESRQTPGRFPEESRPTPAGFPEESRRTPAGFPEESRRTPGRFPEESRRTPGRFPEESRQTPGRFPEESRPTPTGFPEEGRRTPGRSPDQTPEADVEPVPSEAAAVDSEPAPEANKQPTAVSSPGTRTATLERQLPDSIGPYQVLTLLGEGGMGAVYLARQTEPVDRMVALKLIRSSFTTPSALARFNAERQALARLSHPAIAQMFEAGTTDDGFPFFAMEHVPGHSLGRFCDLHKLDIEARLELFLQVCEGVEYAHRKGIIHRDLKPGNILVSKEGGTTSVKIIDFGIAKAIDEPLTDQTLLTRFGMGTPSYMSPEAFEITSGGADVDTRADVYALGVILYELLVGAPPIKATSSSMGDLIRMVTEGVPPRLSQRFAGFKATDRERLAKLRSTDEASLARALPGDLDWITAKAIEKDREQRYGSAGALAADVRRHLDFEPVEAGPPTWGYRASRFVRRHRVGVAAGTIAVTALVLGAVGATWGLLRAEQEAARANAEAEKTREALLDAEEITDFLVELFEIADPREAGGESTTARQLLDRGAARLEEQLGDQPLRRARLMQTIGTVYDQLQVHQEAKTLVEGAVEIQRRESAEPEQLASSLHRLSVVARQLADYEAAEAAAREALELRRQALGDSHALVGETLRELGIALRLGGDAQAAEPLIKEALAIAETTELGDSGEDARAASLEALGNLYQASGRCVEAVSPLERALETRRQRLDAEDPRLALSLNNLASCYSETGRDADARGLFEQALAIQEKIFGPSATHVAIARANLAIVYGRLDENELAESAFRRSRDDLLEALGDAHPVVANPMAELGVLLWKTGRLDEAEKELRRAVAIWTNSPGPEHLLTAWAHWGLANVLRDSGRIREAEENYRKALDVQEAQLPPQHPDLERTRTDYAEALRRLE